MKAFVLEKILNKLGFNFNIIEGKLNIKGYNKKELESKVCPECLIKNFKKAQVIRIKDLGFLEECQYGIEVLNCIELKVDKNKKMNVA